MSIPKGYKLEKVKIRTTAGVYKEPLVLKFKVVNPVARKTIEEFRNWCNDISS